MSILTPTKPLRNTDEPNNWLIFGLPIVTGLDVWNTTITKQHKIRTYNSVEPALDDSRKYGTPTLCKVDEKGKFIAAW